MTEFLSPGERHQGERMPRLGPTSGLGALGAGRLSEWAVGLDSTVWKVAALWRSGVLALWRSGVLAFCPAELQERLTRS